MPNHNMGSQTRRNRRRCLLRAQAHRCAACRAEFTTDNRPTFEHAIPVRDGGANALTNLSLVCRGCQQ